MSSNPDQIVAQMQQDFHNLIAYVRDGQTRTATEVEHTLFRRLLALGLQLLRLFFLTRAALRPATPTTTIGTPCPFMTGVRLTTFRSLASSRLPATTSTALTRADCARWMPT